MRVRAIRIGNAARSRKPRARRSSESGFAYLFALFMILAIIIGSQVALQNFATAGRRERETEMIWRGNQWARAVRLYFHKTGHYPQSVDDLEKGLPELHFLRLAAYKDPMNGEDGSWRFIYVNGGGQIIGSVRYATLQQMALMDLNGGVLPGVQQGALGAVTGTPASSLTSSFMNSSSSVGSTGSSGNSSSGGDTSGSVGGGTQNAQGGQQGAANSSSPVGSSGAGGNSPPDQSAAAAQPGQSAISGQAPNPLAMLQPTGPVDGPVIGAFITGVGSKVDKPSVKIYRGGKKYKDWEFIWNPLEDQSQAMQQGLNNVQQQPGQMGQPAGGFGGGSFGNTGNTTNPMGPAGTPGPQPSPSSPSSSSQ